jgi:hypothetical protein
MRYRANLVLHRTSGAAGEHHALGARVIREYLNMDLTRVMVLLDLLVAAAFVGHLLVQSHSEKPQGYFAPWFIFWIINLGGHALALPILFPDTGVFTRTLYIWQRLLGLLQSVILIYISDRLTRSQQGGEEGRESLGSLLFWSAAILATIVTFVSKQYAVTQLFYAYIGFLALCIYVTRWVASTYPPPATWILIILYFYAGRTLADEWLEYHPDWTALRGLILAARVPFTVILYYSCCRTLWGRRPEIKASLLLPISTGAPVGQLSASGKMLRRMPDPAVEVQLANFWGFLYLLWQYPSGRFVVFLTIISLIAGALYVTSNSTQLLALWKIASP